MAVKKKPARRKALKPPYYVTRSVNADVLADTLNDLIADGFAIRHVLLYGVGGYYTVVALKMDLVR